MKSKQFFVTLAAGLAAVCTMPLAGCGSGGGGNGGNGGGSGLTVSKTFYPLTDASGAALSWTYDTTSTARSRAAAGTGSSYTVRYGGTTTFQGQSVYQFSTAGGAFVTYLDLTTSGVAYAGQQSGGTNSALWGNDWYIRYELSPGQTEEFTSAVGNAAGSYRYRLSRLADQSVTTPAGTFPCAVYRRTALAVTGIATNDYSVGDVDTYWYASQVGLVKDTFQFSDGTTDTAILRSYGASATTLPVPPPTPTGGGAPNPVPAPPH